MVDPNTAQVAEINASTYFKAPFQTLVKPKQFTEYTVINIEPIGDNERHKFSGQGAISKRVSKIFVKILRMILCHAGFTNFFRIEEFFIATKSHEWS